MEVNTSWGGVALNPNDIASPCGAIGINNIMQRKHFSMILFNCMQIVQIQHKFILTKLEYLGQAIKDINTKLHLIVLLLNGSIQKMSILLYG